MQTERSDVCLLGIANPPPPCYTFPMELRVLKYFITIANEQNISRAAQIIHITQPTLSRQIIELEEELGVKLFERNRQNRKFILTDEGVRFYNYAVQITELSQKTVEEFKSNSSHISGKIYIGAGETESLTAIAQAFKKNSRKSSKNRNWTFFRRCQHHLRTAGPGSLRLCSLYRLQKCRKIQSSDSSTKRPMGPAHKKRQSPCKIQINKKRKSS